LFHLNTFIIQLKTKVKKLFCFFFVYLDKEIIKTK